MDLERPAKNKDKSEKESKKLETKEDLQIPEQPLTLLEIRELEQPVKNIISKIKERIEKGEYGLVIGDDVSGRIPARILGGFIKRIIEEKNGENEKNKSIEEKLQKPEIIFIPGKINKPEDLTLHTLLGRFLSQHGIKKGDRILIVTEAILTGKSISALNSLLNELGYHCDIATIGLEERNSEFFAEERRKNLGDSEVISGEYTRKSDTISYTPLIYTNREMSGVLKKRGDLKSYPHKFEELLYKSTEARNYIQGKINKSRREADVLVGKLVKWYSSQNKEKN
jgi:hypothetical protein